MKTQAGKFSYLALLIAGIAVVLFSTAGIARMLGWGLNSVGDPDGIPALEAALTGAGGARPRCPECGVIVSTGANAIIVRMVDGSSRVIDDINPKRWRTGERLIVIAGANPSLP